MKIDTHTNKSYESEFSDVEDFFKSLPPDNPLSIQQSSNYPPSSKELLSVKGNDVCLSLTESQKIIIEKWPVNKEEVAYHLADALDDKYNIAWYQKLARDRRSDLLKNCLIKTFEAFNKGVIKKSLPQYFAGVVKNRTEELIRLEAYKKRTYNHTT